MNLYRFCEGAFVPEANLLSALGAEKSRLIALVGGGGKTTLLYALARAFRREGLRVVLTTTTHTSPAPAGLLAQNEKEALCLLAEKGAAVVALGLPGQKLAAPALSAAQCLSFCDVVLCEADGARSLPLKAPAAHEPALPRGADLVIGCAGLDALHRPLCEVCHRPPEGAALLQKKETARVEPADIAHLLADENGQRKGVKCAYRAALCKADSPARLAQAKKIALLLEQEEISGAAALYFEQEERGPCWF